MSIESDYLSMYSTLFGQEQNATTDFTDSIMIFIMHAYIYMMIDETVRRENIAALLA